MPTGYRDQEVGCLKCPKMPDSCTGIKVKYLNYYNVALGQSCTYINEKMFRPRIHYGSHNLIPRPAGPPSPSPLADQFTYLTRAAVSTGGALIQYKVVFFFFLVLQFIVMGPPQVSGEPPPNQPGHALHHWPRDYQGRPNRSHRGRLKRKLLGVRGALHSCLPVCTVFRLPDGI